MNLTKSLNTTELLDGLRSGIRRARLSLVETVFLAAALFFFTLVVFFYLTKIQPRQSALDSLQQRDRAARAALNKKAKEDEARQVQHDNAGKILGSLNDFEMRLKDRQRGMTQVIDEVNQLAKANRVMVDGGYQFRTIAADVIDGSGSPAQPASGGNKSLSVYPALGIDTTVVGDYHDLRRFISDLERSQQFVIINAIALQSVDEQATRGAKGLPPGPPQGPGQVPAQGPTGPTAVAVSLKIEMDTYFQKPAAQ